MCVACFVCTSFFFACFCFSEWGTSKTPKNLKLKNNWFCASVLWMCVLRNIFIFLLLNTKKLKKSLLFNWVSVCLCVWERNNDDTPQLNACDYRTAVSKVLKNFYWFDSSSHMHAMRRYTLWCTLCTLTEKRNAKKEKQVKILHMQYTSSMGWYRSGKICCWTFVKWI